MTTPEQIARDIVREHVAYSHTVSPESLRDAIATALRDYAATAVATETERCAGIAERYSRDGSFNDSQVGAIEHNANQANIASAIRAKEPTT